MFDILVVGHGPFAKGLVGAARAIVGGDADRATPLALGPDEGLQAFATRIGERLGDDQPALVLADLYGGTPANAALLAARGRQARVIGGANLGMLLDVLAQTEGAFLEPLAAAAVQAGQAGVGDISEALGVGARGGEHG